MDFQSAFFWTLWKSILWQITEFILGQFLRTCSSRSYLAFVGWTSVAMICNAQESPSSVKSEYNRVSIAYNVVYGDEAEPMHRADIYRVVAPKSADTAEAGTQDLQRSNQPVSKRPGVIVIHGGAWTVGDKSNDAQHAKRLASKGVVVMSINYRLAPKHPFPAQIDDCNLALKYMIEHADELGIDTSALGAWGYSAGGHLSALMATDPKPGLIRLKACVSGGAPCDLTTIPAQSQMLATLLGGSRAEVPQRYADASPVTHVSSDDPPMFLFHGSRDRLVPPESSERMCEALKKFAVPFEHIVVTDKAHLMTFIDADSTERSFVFLKQHLDSRN